jgi:hypothetical protein
MVYYGKNVLSVAKIFKYIKMIIEGTVPRDGG